MNLTTAIGQLRRFWRAYYNHGGDDRATAPAPAEPATERDEQIRQEWLDDHLKTGLEELAVRAARHEQDERVDHDGQRADEDTQTRLYPGDGQFVETSVGVKQMKYDGDPGLLFYDKDDKLPTERWVFAPNDALIDTEDWR